MEVRVKPKLESGIVIGFDSNYECIRFSVCVVTNFYVDLVNICGP
jgi:hypothetical protein